MLSLQSYIICSSNDTFYALLSRGYYEFEMMHKTICEWGDDNEETVKISRYCMHTKARTEATLRVFLDMDNTIFETDFFVILS